MNLLARAIAYVMALPFALRAALVLGVQRLSGRPNNGASPPDADTRYDVFLSYPSDASEEVRFIAEMLMAYGLRVWFAEYAINIFDRDQFQAEIDVGLQNSEHFIFFPSESFFASPHCLGELQMAQKIPKLWPGRALAIREKSIPKRVEEEIEATGALSVHYRPGNHRSMEVLFSELTEFLGFPVGVHDRGLMPPGRRVIKQVIHAETQALQLNLKGWKPHANAAPQRRLDRPQIWVYPTDRKPLTCAISARSIGAPEGFSHTSDRERLEAFLATIRPSARHSHEDVVGTHLIHLFGRNQVALTVDKKIDQLRQRTYAIFFDTHDNDEDIYLGLEFRYRGSWQDFLTTMWVADELVNSIELLKPDKPLRKKRLFRV